MALSVEENLEEFSMVFASVFIQNCAVERFEREIQNDMIRFFDNDTKVLYQFLNLKVSNFLKILFLVLFKETSEFSNFKGILFESVFESFITSTDNRFITIYDLETHEQRLVSNVCCDKQIVRVGRSFRENITNHTGENILWTMTKRFPLFDFMFINRQDKIINLYQITTNSQHRLKWTEKVNDIIHLIDHQKLLTINFFLASTKSIYKTFEKTEINFYHQDFKRNINMFSVLTAV